MSFSLLDVIHEATQFIIATAKRELFSQAVLIVNSFLVRLSQQFYIMKKLLHKLRINSWA